MSGNTFAVPAHALGAWTAMHEQILATGPTPCAGPSRNDWLGTQAQQERAAGKCMDCPVLAACDRYARAADERTGTWGGLTARERTSKRSGAA